MTRIGSYWIIASQSFFYTYTRYHTIILISLIKYSILSSANTYNHCIISPKISSQFILYELWWYSFCTDLCYRLSFRVTLYNAEFETYYIVIVFLRERYCEKFKNGKKRNKNAVFFSDLIFSIRVWVCVYLYVLLLVILWRRTGNVRCAFIFFYLLKIKLLFTWSFVCRYF